MTRPMKNSAHRWLVLAGMGLLTLIIILGHKAFGRDVEGRYAQSDNHDWVKSLHSPAGAWCCDITDGRALTDADWRSKDGHYQVKLRDDWLDVPEDAVITQPNKIGLTIAWIGYRNGEAIITCFLAGPMT